MRMKCTVKNIKELISRRINLIKFSNFGMDKLSKKAPSMKLVNNLLWEYIISTDNYQYAARRINYFEMVIFILIIYFNIY